MPIDLNVASCIQCGITEGMLSAVLIERFAVIAGVPADPAALVAAANCLDCQIPPGMGESVLIAQLDGIANP